MKKFILLLFVSFLFTSCGSKSVIITSKAKAAQHDKMLVKKAAPQRIEKNIIVNKKEVVKNKFEPKTTIPTELKTEQLPETIDDEFIIASAINPESVEQDTIEYEKDVNYNPILSEKIIAAALENIGVRYHTGGTNQSGFDCSGLMVASYSKYDVKLPRTSIEMSRFGKRINPKKAQKGDLIFFKTLGSRKINHVGMVIEVNDNEIKFVHASIKKGVMVSTTKEGYYKSKFAQINRVLE